MLSSLYGRGRKTGMQECEPSFPLLQLEPLLWVGTGGYYQVRACKPPRHAELEG